MPVCGFLGCCSPGVPGEYPRATPGGPDSYLEEDMGKAPRGIIHNCLRYANKVAAGEPKVATDGGLATWQLATWPWSRQVPPGISWKEPAGGIIGRWTPGIVKHATFADS